MAGLFSALPSDMQDKLLDYGVMPSGLQTLLPAYKTPMPTDTGQAKEFMFKDMNPNVQGATISTKNGPIVLYNPSDTDPNLTRAHEMEHVLAQKQYGYGAHLNSMWDKTVDPGDATRDEIVERLVQHAPYLAQKWGLPEDAVKGGYFSSAVLGRPDMPNFLYEQMATLSALEYPRMAKQGRLTDDPYVRKNIFKTEGERETYNALTGLRQTRLDARDLPPHTRIADPVPEKNIGVMEKIKNALGFYGGGFVERTIPGGNKFI